MSRQQSALRNTVGYMLKNIGNQTTNGEEKSKPEVIKLGLDLHARQVTECRQLDGSTPKPAQQWDPSHGSGRRERQHNVLRAEWL